MLCFSLPGKSAPATVRAILVGSRIDLRRLAGATDLERLDLHSTGVALVFRHGVVVLFGVRPEAERDFLRRTAEQAFELLPAGEIETATIAIRAGDEEHVDPHGNIRLCELTPERLLLAGTVLAQSTILARHEAEAFEIFERTEPLIAALKGYGRVTYRSKRMLRQIGEVLETQHRMIGRVQISDKPDVLWDHPELDKLYRRLESEFELAERAQVVDRKFRMVGDTADALLSLLHHRQSVRLELAIIALIMCEIVIGLVEKLT